MHGKRLYEALQGFSRVACRYGRLFPVAFPVSVACRYGIGYHKVESNIAKCRYKKRGDKSPHKYKIRRF